MIVKNRNLLNPDGSPTPELLNACIKEHIRELPRLHHLGKYYDGDHAIKQRILPNGLPNLKLVANHAEYISDVVVGYVHGAPISYSGDGSEELNELFIDMEEDSHNADLGLDISIYGRGYELTFMSDDVVPNPELAILAPENTNLVVDNTVRKKDMFAFQIVPNVSLTGRTESYDINVYTSLMEITYNCKNLSGPYEEIDRRVHYFREVPVTEYRNNKKMRGDYEGQIPLIDAYNILQSDRMNDKEQLADALLAIINSSLGDDEEEVTRTASFIKDHKILELAEGGDAKWLVKTMNETEIEVLKKSIKDDIHEFSMVPCLTDENFVGNSSGIAMKYKLLGLESLGKTKERYFKRGLRHRIKLIGNIFQIKGRPFDATKIDIVMKRTLPVDDELAARIASETEGFLSWETRVKRFDEELDPDKERELLEEEQTKATEKNAKAFGSYTFHDTGDDED